MGDRSGGRTVAVAVAGAAALAACLLEWGPAAAQGHGSRPLVYGSEHACRTGRVLSDSDCRNAFLNAEAELDEKSPRFKTRADCEKAFRRCMIGLPWGAPSRGGKGVYFTPRMNGVRISFSGRERAVVPVVDVEFPNVVFSPRPVSRASTERSAARRAQAQAMWDNPPPPPADTPTTFGGADQGPDTSPLRPGEMTSYPVSTERLREMREAERKYGTPDPSDPSVPRKP